MKNGLEMKGLHPIVQDAFAGAAAGFCTGSVIGPAEGFKVWLQVTNPPRNYFTPELYKNLFKMTPSFAINFAGVCALEFSVNKTIGERYDAAAGVTASALTGAAFLTAADHLMFRSIKGEGTVDALKKLYKIRPLALWTGFFPMVGREGIFITSVMHLGPLLGKKIQTHFDTDKEMSCAAAGRLGAGVVTTIMSQPFDALTRKMQVSLDENPLVQPKFFTCLKESSLKSLSRGVVPRIGLAAFGGALAGGFFDVFRNGVQLKNKADVVVPPNHQPTKGS